VGIFFSPPTSNGILRIWSNPSYLYEGDTIAVLDWAYSDGWIGLYVGEFDLSGGFVASAIDQQTTLWSIDSWLQTVDQPGTSSGFPLFAELNVDNDHFYEIWVWCGVDSSAAGMGTFWGSGADSFLSITVPSITWELC
jgi:hypothetical protein